ncbi:hypothetical protein [Nostoc sp.]|uniref:hypothetical protein n=1 Tax=Nostoc sp. TaxID=1180 RepID=UPI002FFA5874
MQASLEQLSQIIVFAGLETAEKIALQPCKAIAKERLFSMKAIAYQQNSMLLSVDQFKGLRPLHLHIATISVGI